MAALVSACIELEKKSKKNKDLKDPKDPKDSKDPKDLIKKRHGI